LWAFGIFVGLGALRKVNGLFGALAPGLHFEKPQIEFLTPWQPTSPELSGENKKQTQNIGQE
jgi:hypothetical protein